MDEPFIAKKNKNNKALLDWTVGFTSFFQTRSTKSLFCGSNPNQDGERGQEVPYQFFPYNFSKSSN